MGGEAKTICELYDLAPAEMLVCLYKVVANQQLKTSQKELLTNAKKTISEAKKAKLNPDYPNPSELLQGIVEPSIKIGVVDFQEGLSVTLNVVLMGDTVDCEEFFKKYGVVKLNEAKRAIGRLSHQKRLSH